MIFEVGENNKQNICTFTDIYDFYRVAKTRKWEILVARWVFILLNGFDIFYELHHIRYEETKIITMIKLIKFIESQNMLYKLKNKEK